MPFGVLVTKFLDPLDRIRKGGSQPPGLAAKRKGPLSSEERRRLLMEELIKENKDRGGDMYPVIRLVVPELDVETGPSNIKEKIMGKILPRVLMCHGKTSADRIRLAEWGPQTKGEDGRHIPFIDICRDVIEKRSLRETSSMTVDQVCGLLDQLRAETKEDRRVEVLGEMSCALTPGELTWVLRIILDDVHLGMKSTFLSMWHPQAEELMRSRSCLRVVCWKLDAGQPVLGPDELGVQLSWCFQPQLASRQVTKTDGTLRDLLEKTVDRLGVGEGEAFHVEEKLDGERMQVHVTVGRDGRMNFRWWTRQGLDYTHRFGSNESEGTLARYISGAFERSPAGCNPLASMILDGEMVVWDSGSDAVLPHITHSPIADHGRYVWPLFRAFDIVYFNGNTLTKYPLSQRHRLMSTYLVGVEHRFERHLGTSATTIEQLEASFEEAMLDGREGLVVKNLSSAYEPGARPSSWMKLKPEYSSEYGRPLECVIIGRSYGRGSNSGKLTRILCGIQEGGGSGRWLSFCGLGSGISRAARAEIDMRTNGKWHNWGDGAAASEFIQLGRSGHEAPDQWIVPDQSVVISVKAAAINSSKMYAAETGLLHPRLDQLPALKPSQALSKADIDAMESVRSIRESAAASSKPVKQRAGGKVLTLAGKHSDAAMATPAQSDLFANKSFFIGAACDDPELSKDEMVALVRKNGGSVFYDYRKSDYAISHRVTWPILLRIRGGNDDIIHPKWLVECDQQQRVVDLHEGYRTRRNVGAGTKDSHSSDDDEDDDFFEPVTSTR